jgi:hypothetical protein
MRGVVRQRMMEPAMSLSPQNFFGHPIFKEFQTLVTAKLVSEIMIANEAKLTPALMAYFHGATSLSK